MIGMLKGRVESVDTSNAVVDVHGVGFELRMPSNDLTAMHMGQDVKIYTSMSVSQDAIVRNKPQEKPGEAPTGTETASSEPKGQELVYSARVSLDRPEMDVDGRTVNLAPGMAVTVEIKTGTRTILSYLISPLIRYGQESLRER